MALTQRADETATGFTVRIIKAETIQRELEQLAADFENAGPEWPWTGQEIADNIRDRIKNHPALATTTPTSPSK